MFRWILLAVLAVGLAKDFVEPEVAESKHHHSLGANLAEDLPGTGVFREIHPTGHPLPKSRIEKQNKIVYDVFSPTYSQPTWYLDYRYLKTGGREYVRGDGGQILILPKGVHAKDHGYEQWGDFDELLEFLRLQELAEKEQRAKERGLHGHSESSDRFYPADERESHMEPIGWEREAENERRWQGGHKGSKH